MILGYGVRSPSICSNTAKMLEEYLRFRRFFRKRYGYDLNWTNIKNPVKKMPVLYKALEKYLNKAFEGV